MKHNLTFILATTACFASFTFAADVAIFPVEVTNLTKGQADAIGMVMAQSYTRNSNTKVLSPSKTLPALTADSNDMTAAAKTLQVKEYLSMSAVALDTKILVQASIFDINGALLFHSEMTATSMDDISEVCDRISKALIQRVTSEETMTLENITKHEGDEVNRVFVDKIKGVKVQMIGSVASGSAEPLVGIGFNMRVEAKRGFLEFGAQPFFPTSGIDSYSYNDEYKGHRYGGAYIELGGNYYLSNNKDVSPYIGGGLSPRFIFGTSDFFGIGLAPYVQTGVMLMRYSRMRMYIDLRLAQNVMPMIFNQGKGVYNPSTYSTDYPRKKLYPTEIGLSLGMGW